MSMTDAAGGKRSTRRLCLIHKGDEGTVIATELEVERACPRHGFLEIDLPDGSTRYMPAVNIIRADLKPRPGPPGPARQPLDVPEGISGRPDPWPRDRGAPHVRRRDPGGGYAASAIVVGIVLALIGAAVYALLEALT